MDFNSVTKTWDGGKDAIAIRNYVGGIAGGKFLDMTNYPTANDTIPVLTPIVLDTTTGKYSPIKLGADGYIKLKSTNDAIDLGTNDVIVGLTVHTVMANRPGVGIINAGEVNDKCIPFIKDAAMLAIVKAAIKDALPTLILTHD